MLEVHYCSPSPFSKNAYATGSRRFNNGIEFAEWLASNALLQGPVLITGIVWL
jgi:hypothetical protein